MAAAAAWNRPDKVLPDEKEEVRIRVRGEERAGYYRISDRWYDAADVERWRMCTARSWERDRAWYLKNEDVEAWQPL